MRSSADLSIAREVILARGMELGRPLHLLAETTSTNDEAKRAANGGAPHGSTWVAESQTAGRGRQGRTWVSPPGENLLFSVLLRTTAPPERLPLVSLVAGLAVAEAVERSAPSARPLLKWPNDVVVVGARGEMRKLAGVLVETSMTGGAAESVVVGIGVNVHTRTFPAELADRTTSLSLLCDTPPDRAAVLADVLEALDRHVWLVLARGLGTIRSLLERRDALRGRRVTSQYGEGMACGIGSDGQLLVTDGTGARVSWSSGEVHLV